VTVGMRTSLHADIRCVLDCLRVVVKVIETHERT